MSARSPGCFCGGGGPGLGRECFGYAKAPWGVCSKGASCTCDAAACFAGLGPGRSGALSGAVPSPCQALASGFGMGPGVSPGPWPPQIFSYTVRRPAGSAGLQWRPGNRTADADMSMFRLVARQCSLPSGVVCRRKMRSNRQGLECWCCFRPLVPVGSRPGASTVLPEMGTRRAVFGPGGGRGWSTSGLSNLLLYGTCSVAAGTMGTTGTH